jgi:hypothetical protein
VMNDPNVDHFRHVDAAWFTHCLNRGHLVH